MRGLGLEQFVIGTSLSRSGTLKSIFTVEYLLEMHELLH